MMFQYVLLALSIFFMASAIFMMCGAWSERREEE